MEIETSLHDKVIAVTVKGRVDVNNAEKLSEHLNKYASAGSARLVIDLKDVTYISSAGFRALLITARSVRQVDGKLALCGVVGEVKRLFDMASFTDLFVILPNLDDAIAAANA